MFFLLFVNLSLFWENKKYKKSFILIKFYIPYSENKFTFQHAKYCV